MRNRQLELLVTGIIMFFIFLIVIALGGIYVDEARASAKKPVEIHEPVRLPPGSEEEPKNPANGEITPDRPQPPAPAPVVDPGLIVSGKCDANTAPYEMVDYVGAGSASFYAALKSTHRKVRIVGRYYDWEKESLKGKIPRAQELADLKREGFDVVTVFQHLNNQAASFTKGRGMFDAQRVLELAGLWGQPKGSAAYFGVDGDFAASVPEPYFAAAAPIIRAAGYRVGMYGSFGNCENLAKKGLIDMSADGVPLCWIAASSWGWRGTKAAIARGTGYAIAQKVNQQLAGKGLDYDNLCVKDVGQWRIP